MAVGMIVGGTLSPHDDLPFDPEYHYTQHELFGPEILAAAKAMDALHQHVLSGRSDKN
jgi:hypothetical protein